MVGDVPSGPAGPSRCPTSGCGSSSSWCRPRSASSWSASPTPSSRPGRSRAPRPAHRRHVRRWGRSAWPTCFSGDHAGLLGGHRARRARRSTTRWAPARRWPASTAAAIIAVVLLVLTGPVAYLPTACLGAVIIVAGLRPDQPQRVAHARARRPRRGRDRRHHHGRRASSSGCCRPCDRRGAVDRERGAPQRPPARRGARLLGDAWAAGPTCASTRRRASRPASWSTASTTGCSSPTRPTSRGASASRWPRRRRRCTRWCSTPSR